MLLPPCLQCDCNALSHQHPNGHHVLTSLTPASRDAQKWLLQKTRRAVHVPSSLWARNVDAVTAFAICTYLHLAACGSVCTQLVGHLTLEASVYPC